MATDRECDLFDDRIGKIEGWQQRTSVEFALAQQSIIHHKEIIDILKEDITLKADKVALDAVNKRVDSICDKLERTNLLLIVAAPSLMLIALISMQQQFPEIVPAVVRFIKFLIEMVKYL